uniref:Saposin B-type domain-containing protein n=1 Tax=Rhabditophanes sp. KR3021 TaxID=114890 RepID=A0AC35TQF0_9BILA
MKFSAIFITIILMNAFIVSGKNCRFCKKAVDGLREILLKNADESNLESAVCTVALAPTLVLSFVCKELFRISKKEILTGLKKEDSTEQICKSIKCC